MDRIKYYIQKHMLPSIIGRGMGVGLLLLCLGLTSSCEDMLDKGNKYVIYDTNHLISSPSDTVTSVLGILNKLQGIAVRNNLLGEVRADLVTLSNTATIDLKDMASLDMQDDNPYNAPRDYYAIINNCNYFLAHADSLAGNRKRDMLYFEAEIAQVHSIRAWTYLQLALVYGKVPFVTDPVVTKLQSEKEYPMYSIEQVCDYFVEDLRPYYGKAYPNYTSFDVSGFDPKTAFFPTQVVMGDLYLWLAAIRHDPAMAREAAKAYYDYIVWDLNGKKPLTTTTRRAYWSSTALTSGSLRVPSGILSYSPTGVWGAKNAEFVTAIPMDSAAADGYFNELRYLYNSQPLSGTESYNSIQKEASIVPSQILRDLSQSYDYVGRDNVNRPVRVTAERLEEEQIREGYLGDLRFQDSYSHMTGRSAASGDATYQRIAKHNYQHVLIYRAAQIYLRLAEALNYAGYPRFARQILTTGLNNNVIQYEVQPYYTTAQDTAFIRYFDFNTVDFVPYIQDYKWTTNKYGVTTGVSYTLLSEDELTANCNTWGIHGRGSGLPFLDEFYAPYSEIDSVGTGYPYALEEAVGDLPLFTDDKYKDADGKEVKKPSTWDQFPGVVCTLEEYLSCNHARNESILPPKYDLYIENDSVGAYKAVYDLWQADLADYKTRLEDFKTAYIQWYKNVYSSAAFIESEQNMIDALILDDQALELAYEGNRFYDLMRRAYWYNDNSIIANAVSRRDAGVGAKLMNRQNWFLQWKGQIGFEEEKE